MAFAFPPSCAIGKFRAAQASQYYHPTHMTGADYDHVCSQDDRMEEKPARLTVLIDAEKKKAFDALCASQDITASQVVRQLIREYLTRHGVDWSPARPDAAD